MTEQTSRYTAEHSARELESEVANLRLENHELKRVLREISTNWWYRLGRMLWLCR